MPVRNGINPTAMFSGIAAARTRQSCNFERVGNYIELIQSVVGDRNRKEESRVDVHKTVLVVLPAPAQSMASSVPNAPPIRPHFAGENITHRMCKKWDSFLGNVKAFVACCTGMSPEQITEENAASVLGEDNPLQFTVVEVENRNVVTKANRDFTEVNYKRLVSYREIKPLLSDAVMQQCFPNGLLDRLIEAEVNAESQAAAA